MLKTYYFFMISCFVSAMDSSQGKTVIHELSEVENIVIETLSSEWKSIPREDPDIEVRNDIAIAFEIFVNLLLRNYGICALPVKAKARYCNLALQTGEEHDTAGHTMVNSMCGKFKIQFKLQHPDTETNPSVWMYACPKIKGNAAKIYYLGRYDGSLTKLIVYERSQKKIFPIRVILDITLFDLYEIPAPHIATLQKYTESFNKVLDPGADLVEIRT